MEDDYKKMLYDAFAPHFSAFVRKTKGCPEGTLKCEDCGAMNASKNRQRTAYVDSDNTRVLCPRCQEEADRYWNEMWEEHYYNCSPW